MALTPGPATLTFAPRAVYFLWQWLVPPPQNVSLRGEPPDVPLSGGHLSLGLLRRASDRLRGALLQDAEADWGDIGTNQVNSTVFVSGMGPSSLST